MTNSKRAILAKSAGLTAFAVMIASAGFAQDVDPAMDMNGDGMLSFPELIVAYPDMTEEAFSAMDTTGDGVLDGAEVTAAVDAGILMAPEG